MNDFNTVIDRRDSDSVKYGMLEHFFGDADIIPLWVADTDFASADFIVEALNQRVQHKVFGYPYRSERYDKAIQGWLSRRTAWEIQTQWLGFAPGVVAGVGLSILSFTNEGDGVMIQPPVYHPFAMTVKANNRTVVNNQLINTDNGYVIDFEDFEEKLKISKVFILCNPHNPTGRCFTEEELRRMGELCVKYDVKIIADEIHMDYVYAPHRHIHIASLSPEIAARTITFIAPSKSFNIAGFFTAVAISSSAKLLEGYKKEQSKLHLENGNIFGITALQTAYEKGDEWMDQMKAYIETNVDFVVGFLKEKMPSVKCHKPEATYLLWLDFSQWGLTQNELNDFMVKQAKLGMNTGVMFGDGGTGFMRMNIGAPLSVIQKAMDQMYAAAKASAFV